MKAIGKLNLIHSVTVVALALCISPSLGKAQDFHGKFTLPFEAQWGAAVLPPGDYAFSIESISPHNVFLRGDGKNAIISPFPMPEEKVSSDQSKLTLVDNGGRYVVRSLEAAELGVTFEYPTAKAKVRTKQVAQRRGFMRHIPVSTSAP